MRNVQGGTGCVGDEGNVRIEYKMETINTLNNSEKTIVILLIGDRWWPQKAKQEG